MVLGTVSGPTHEVREMAELVLEIRIGMWDEAMNCEFGEERRLHRDLHRDLLWDAGNLEINCEPLVLGLVLSIGTTFVVCIP